MSTEGRKLELILNLALTVLSRTACPATKTRAENLLLELTAPGTGMSLKDEWHIRARASCPNWKTL